MERRIAEKKMDNRFPSMQTTSAENLSIPEPRIHLQLNISQISKIYSTFAVLEMFYTIILNYCMEFNFVAQAVHKLQAMECLKRVSTSSSSTHR